MAQVIRTGLGEVEFVDVVVPAGSTNRQVALGTYHVPGSWQTPDALLTNNDETVTLRLLVGTGHLNPVAGRYYAWCRYTLTPEVPIERRSKSAVLVVTDAGVPLDPAVQYVLFPQVAAALARNPDALVTGTVTRDANGAATAAAVTWPDGATGVYAADTVSTAFPGAVDAYHVTHVAGGVTVTYTQPAVTRDASTGAVVNVPAMVVT